MKGMIDCGGSFKVGDPMPDGYAARIDWADVHIKAGLKQEVCCVCCRYFFPHQLNPKVYKTKAVEETRLGRMRHFKDVILEHRKCLECDPVKTT